MSSSHLLTSLLSPMEAVAGGEAAVPSYLLTTAEAPPPEEDGDEGGLEDILQVFKIFKLARVLKLARHSPGLQVSRAPASISLQHDHSRPGHRLHAEEQHEGARAAGLPHHHQRPHLRQLHILHRAALRRLRCDCAVL